MTVTANALSPAELLTVLAEPVRRQMYELLVQRSQSVGELAQSFAVTRSAVSQHLKVLKSAGLVSEIRSGQQRIYSITTDASGRLQSLADYLRNLGGPAATLAPELSSQQREVDAAGGVDDVDWRTLSDEVEPEVVALVARMFILARAMEQLLAETADRHQLNVGEVLILGTLRRLGTDQSRTPTQLAKSALTSMPGIAKRLNRLEQLGLVARAVDSRDRRSSQVQLTDKGREVMAQIGHEQFACNYAAFSLLSAAERDQLNRSLRFLLQQLPSKH